MSSLAGKPPFATDEPDSYYESSAAPQRRVRQPAPEDPNKRTSAYNVYDNYLGNDGSKLPAPPAAPNRNSGIGALLMNMDDDSDSDDDDDAPRKPSNPPGISSASKNATLAAAVSSTNTRPSPPPQRQPQEQGQAQARNNTQAPPPQPRSPPPKQASPQPIAAPRPGYAAPIAALNLARPEAAAAPGGRGPMPPGGPPSAPGGAPQLRLQNPFEPPFAQQVRSPFANPPPSPAPSSHSSTPHPLQPPVTPITPVFIRPSKSPAPVNVKFEEGKATPRKQIIRGNSEETLLPSRGEKGDDFWRRFSIVAKEESRKPSAQKESSWLRQMHSGSNRHSRWIWITGIALIVIIAAAIGFGIYATRGTPDHQQPTAIGGSADNLATGGAVTPTASGDGTKTVLSSTRLHVSPTNTVARRDEVVVPTAVVRRHVSANAKRRLELARID